MHIILFLCSFILLSIPAHAEDSIKFEPINFPSSSYITLATKKIKNVVDGNLLEAEDGSFLRLDGIRIPAQYNRDTPSELNVAAKNILEEHFKEKNASIYVPQKSRQDHAKNRLGQIQAQIVSPEGLWAQKLLLENGLAYAYPSDYTKESYAYLLRAETIARENKTGLWGKDTYAILSPKTIAENSYLMQLVEGVIVSVATVRGNMYLNFGQDWKTDFTIMIPSAVRKEMSKSGLNPTEWQGKNIRVRGFVEDYNGPMIKLTFAEQLEVLD
jgi:endonuclease YncB( thermonuclease family)